MTIVERQVKSKRRVADCGEVFTAKREVEAMIDLVKDEVERYDSKVLEPSCGDGNFLAPILERKLAVVRAKFGADPTEYRKRALVALGSLYGVELLDDNARDCRERLFGIWAREYADVACENRDDDALKIARRILDENIVRGNFLTLKRVDENADDLDEPIIIAEWLLKDDQIVCRREALQAEQTKMETNTLFDMETTENAKIETTENVVAAPSVEPAETTQDERKQTDVSETNAPKSSEPSQNLDVQATTEISADLFEQTPKKKTRAKKESDPNKPKRTRKSKKATEETRLETTETETFENPVEKTENVLAEETKEESEKALVAPTFETKIAVVSRLLEENVVGLAERFLRNASDSINDENFRVCRFDKSIKLDAALDEASEALTDAENAARTADLETCRPTFERFSNACQKCCNIINRISSLSEEKRNELIGEAKEIINAISPYL